MSFSSARLISLICISYKRDKSIILTRASETLTLLDSSAPLVSDTLLLASISGDSSLTSIVLIEPDGTLPLAKFVSLISSGRGLSVPSGSFSSFLGSISTSLMRSIVARPALPVSSGFSEIVPSAPIERDS